MSSTVEAAAANRRVALAAKLEILDRETEAWQRLSANAQATFALHHSQIDEVCGDVRVMRGLIDKALAALPADAGGDAMAAQERRILAAMQIWECYRAKWAQRVEGSLRETLDLLDDLAWAAYRPARDRAADSGQLPAAARRLPPLVFTNPRWSPFARSREHALEMDEESGVLREVDDFEPYLRAMSLPLVGVPWTMAAHLPDAVLIGHEVGHLVEEDLHLEDALTAAVDAELPADASPERRSAWTGHWRSELFADAWGVLCSGPAFAEALVAHLAGGNNIAVQVAPDRYGRWGEYPPTWLRAMAAIEAVRQLGAGGPGDPFPDVADRLAARWRADWPEHAMGADFEADLPVVARALLRTPLAAFARTSGGEPVCALDVLPFTADMHRAAEKDAEEALLLRGPFAADVRTLFAGLTRAFQRDGAEFAARMVSARFRARLLQRRTTGLRHAEADGATKARAADAVRGDDAARVVFMLADGTGAAMRKPSGGP